LTRIAVEASVETEDAALAAQDAGASRVELCANLAEDGVTPASSIVAAAVERLRIPVFMIIRPRPGGFVYDDNELRIMLRDIRGAAASGLAGVVTGALRADGSVDAAQTRAMVDAAAGLPVTFHRAFDQVADKARALDTLVETGVSRVLTSGGAKTALEGAGTIRALVQQAGDRIAIVAGGGVRAHNVRETIARTGVREVHSRFIDRDGMRRLVDLTRAHGAL
jgi:copper homeostasis protein